MTRLSCLLIALFSLCCISAAVAQSSNIAATPPPAPAAPAATAVPDPNAPFQDWETMKDYLDSQGIDSNAVNWGAIDPYCEGTKMDSGDIAYNKCLYQKAMDSSLFTTQKAQCQTLAIAHYPDSLLQKQVDIRSGTAMPPLTMTDLQNKRNAGVLRCMMDLGWASATDWTIGHTTPITPTALPMPQ